MVFCLLHGTIGWYHSRKPVLCFELYGFHGDSHTYPNFIFQAVNVSPSMAQRTTTNFGEGIRLRAIELLNIY